jgi:hypothetical protein
MQFPFHSFDVNILNNIPITSLEAKKDVFMCSAPELAVRQEIFANAFAAKFSYLLTHKYVFRFISA